MFLYVFICRSFLPYLLPLPLLYLSSILYPLSSIIYPLSSIIYPLSSIIYSLSSILSHLSSIIYHLSFILYHLSSIIYSLLSILTCINKSRALARPRYFTYTSNRTQDFHFTLLILREYKEITNNASSKQWNDAIVFLFFDLCVNFSTRSTLTLPLLCNLVVLICMFHSCLSVPHSFHSFSLGLRNAI